MPDIPDSNWSERDDRNAENVPFGWPPGLPAFIEQIGQMMMGAIKRFWNRANPVYVTGGTLDAYTVTPEAKVSFINMYEVIRVRIDRANTTTTPTLKWSDANPRTIVKILGTGVVPLAVGDLIAGRDHSFWYNGTNFVLSNPGTVTAAETTGLLKSANNLNDVANAATSLSNIGGMAKATYDPQNINADAFARANQTGTQAQSTVVNLVTDLAGKLASGDFTSDDTVDDTDALLYLTSTTPKKALLTGLVTSIFKTARTISNAQFASATFKLFNAAGTPRAATFDNTAMTVDRTLTLQDRDMTVGMVLLSKGSIPTTAAVDFAVPSGVRRLVLILSSLSTNGTSVPIIQLKAGGAAETTGYNGSTFSFVSSGIVANLSGGFSLATGNAAANVHHAKVEIILQDGNTWVGTVLNSLSNTGANHFTTGSKTLAGVLDGVRLTTVGGTEVPDSGVYALYAEY